MQLAALLVLSLFLTSFAVAYADSPKSLDVRPAVPPPVVLPRANADADPTPKKRNAPCPVLNLHQAIYTREAKCMGQALQNMDVNDRDVKGDTALHKAIEMNNLPVIKFLVKHGADIHYKDFQGHDSRGIAEERNNRRLVDYFLELERETERLSDAVESNDIVAASSSLLRGPAIGTRDIRLDTLLHRAAQSNFPDMGRLLIHHGAKLESKNYLGETPLISAALRDHFEFMEMLVNAGANVNAIDERRRTVLDLAGVKENPKVMKLLKAAKAREGVAASVEHDWSESGAPVGPWGTP